MVAQSRRVFQNLKAILNSVGGEMNDIVSVIVYVAEIEPLIAVHEVRKEFFSEPYAASTLV